MRFSVNRLSTKKCGTVLCIILGISLIAGEAFAWQRNISRSGPQGNTVSRSINTARTGDGYTRSSTVQGPQGRSITRTGQGSWDPQTQSWTRTRTVTGPQGASRSKEVTASRSANGYTRQSTLTGPQGNTATRSASGQWDPTTQTWTKSVTTQRGN
ncbi:hypothetical protein JWJ90_12940 [Desulfobulbus rhabdoformis]|uniref:hypothetical protein n=1 Tax=Desulfobulbus rhabdoformis TaxID=34032 RepID=UPI001962A888|nr:hypothetical protein [Desulfobulbus rhabdoformis]MBM9615186.1 hypothetical protein [Desulfobulbus rhabdoformis]